MELASRREKRRPQLRGALPGLKARAIIHKDVQYISPSYTRFYPLVIADAKGCWVRDVDGNEFLDMTAGISVTTTGHAHPQVVRAIQAQAEKFLHMCGTDFYYEAQANLAERLAKKMPGSDSKRVFFCNSGTEAIEGALKLARYHSGRSQIIAFLGAFHGRSMGSLSLTASKITQREKFSPLVPGVHHVVFPNPQNRPPACSPENYASQCVDFIRQEVFTKIVAPAEVAAVFVEPIQGEGGYIVPPSNFLRELQALCREHHILLVVDEIQTGLGRTGKFFACEHFGVEPDIITVAKGLASGLPLGAILSRSEIMDWAPGSHGSTFGGNPVACEAALITLDLIEGGLMKNAQFQGEFLRSKLEKLKNDFNFIKEVRGLGLMLAFELNETSVNLREKIISLAFENGLLILPCGKREIRFCPALTIESSEIEVAIEILEGVFHQIEKES